MISITCAPLTLKFIIDQLEDGKKFLDDFVATFDMAAVYTPFEKGLLEQIKVCNVIYTFHFPIEIVIKYK